MEIMLHNTYRFDLLYDASGSVAHDTQKFYLSCLLRLELILYLRIALVFAQCRCNYSSHVKYLYCSSHEIICHFISLKHSAFCLMTTQLICQQTGYLTSYSILRW